MASLRRPRPSGLVQAEVDARIAVVADGLDQSEVDARVVALRPVRTAAADQAGPGAGAFDLGVNNALEITTVDTGLVLTVSGGAIGDTATITVSAGAGALTLPGVTLLTTGAIPAGAVDIIVWKNAAGNLVATWGTST